MALARSLLVLLAALTPLGTHAQTWPAKPIRFIVPFAPGGGNDILARVVGKQMTLSLGQPIVVENLPGAGGNIGPAAVARSAPDGYTFLVAAHALFATNPHLYVKLPYDPLKDFDPVGLIGELPVVVVEHPDVAATTIGELIGLAKAKPQSLSYASAGIGTPHHLAAELFNAMTGTTLVHVPYKGGAPAATDLLAGRVQVMFAPINNVNAQVREGKLRLLATGTAQRLPPLPNMPTVAEAGVPGYRMDNWIGLAAPAGTPKPIVAAMNAALERMLAQPEVRETLLAHGIEPMTATPERMLAMIQADLPRWGAIIRGAGIKAD